MNILFLIKINIFQLKHYRFNSYYVKFTDNFCKILGYMGITIILSYFAKRNLIERLIFFIYVLNLRGNIFLVTLRKNTSFVVIVVSWKPHHSRCHTHKSLMSNLVQWPAAALGSIIFHFFFLCG